MKIIIEIYVSKRHVLMVYFEAKCHTLLNIKKTIIITIMAHYYCTDTFHLSKR